MDFSCQISDPNFIIPVNLKEKDIKGKKFKEKLASELKLEPNQFEIVNLPKEDVIGFIKNKHQISIQINPTRCKNIKFHLPNDKHIIIENCYKMTVNEIIPHFEANDIHFFTNCIQSIRFQISNIHLPKIQYPFYAVFPKKPYDEVKIILNHIILDYGQKKFIFLDKAKVGEAKKIIFDTFKEIGYDKYIHILNKEDKKEPNWLEPLSTKEKYIIYSEYQFNFVYKSSKKIENKQYMDYLAKVSDAKTLLAEIYSNSGELKPRNIIIYINNEIADENQFLKDIQNSDGEIFFDIKKEEETKQVKKSENPKKKHKQKKNKKEDSPKDESKKNSPPKKSKHSKKKKKEKVGSNPIGSKIDEKSDDYDADPKEDSKIPINENNSIELKKKLVFDENEQNLDQSQSIKNVDKSKTKQNSDSGSENADPAIKNIQSRSVTINPISDKQSKSTRPKHRLNSNEKDQNWASKTTKNQNQVKSKQNSDSDSENTPVITNIQSRSVKFNRSPNKQIRSTRPKKLNSDEKNQNSFSKTIKNQNQVKLMLSSDSESENSQSNEKFQQTKSMKTNLMFNHQVKSTRPNKTLDLNKKDQNSFSKTIKNQNQAKLMLSSDSESENSQSNEKFQQFESKSMKIVPQSNHQIKSTNPKRKLNLDEKDQVSFSKTIKYQNQTKSKKSSDSESDSIQLITNNQSKSMKINPTSKLQRKAIKPKQELDLDEKNQNSDSDENSKTNSAKNQIQSKDTKLNTEEIEPKSETKSIEIKFMFNESSEEKFDPYSEKVSIDKTIEELEEEIRQKFNIDKKIIIGYKSGQNLFEIDHDMNIEDVIDDIKTETKSGETENVLYIKITQKPKKAKSTRPMKSKPIRSFVPKTSPVKISPVSSFTKNDLNEDEKNQSNIKQQKLTLNQESPLLNNGEEDKEKNSFKEEEKIEINISDSGEEDEKDKIENYDQHKIKDKKETKETEKRNEMKEEEETKGTKEKYKYYYRTNQDDEIEEIELEEGTKVKEFKKEICRLNEVDNLANIKVIFAGKDLLNDIVLDELNVGDTVLYIYIRTMQDILLMTAKALQFNKDDFEEEESDDE